MISKKIFFIGYILLVTFDHWSKGTGQKLQSKAPPYNWSKKPSKSYPIKMSCPKLLIQNGMGAKNHMEGFFD
jgi:hypothetical protein